MLGDFGCCTMERQGMYKICQNLIFHTQDGLTTKKFDEIERSVQKASCKSQTRTRPKGPIKLSYQSTSF